MTLDDILTGDGHPGPGPLEAMVDHLHELRAALQCLYDERTDERPSPAMRRAKMVLDAWRPK